MGVSYQRGQQIGRDDLHIFVESANGLPMNPAEISYAIYDFTTGQETLVGPPRRGPANPSVGEFYANIVIPLDANIGDYRVRWTFRETVNGPIQQAVQEFSVMDRGVEPTSPFSTSTVSLMQSLRILLRDNCVGGEEQVELDVNGERMVVTLHDLWDSLHDLSQPPPA